MMRHILRGATSQCFPRFSGLCVSAVGHQQRYLSGHVLPTLTLYTKDPCPLCDEALEQLTTFQHRYVLEKVDITLLENKDYFKRYRYDIPVFHFNGEFLMKHKVDLQLVENTLSAFEEKKK